MPDSQSARILIVHAWHDIEFASRLFRDLKASDLQVRIADKTLDAGQGGTGEISCELEWCDCYLPIISNVTLSSRWCWEEINTAMALSTSPDRKGHPTIIPILAEHCEQALPALVASHRYIKFANRYAEALKELAELISKNTGGQFIQAKYSKSASMPETRAVEPANRGTSRNPFIYNRPVSPPKFVNRKSETQTLFSRINNREASSIVGEPRIGKTSLLKHLIDLETRRAWFGETFTQFTFLYMDCQELAASFSTTDFWNRVIASIKQAALDDLILQLANHAIENQYNLTLLEKLFQILGQRNRCVVLLFDEFDALFDHANLSKADFWIALRALATRTDGLEFVTASQSSVAEMNRKCRQILPAGSPILNNSIEVRLKIFTDEDAREIIHTGLEASATIQFSSEEYNFILALAGTHPFLVQVAGASMYDAIADGLAGGARYAQTVTLFHQRAATHLADFWHRLADGEKCVLIFLALGEYCGFVDGCMFDMRQLGKLERYAPELHQLRERGILKAERAPNAVAWLNEHWRVASAGIVTWLMKNVIVGLNTNQKFDTVKGLEFPSSFTPDEIIKLREIANKIPQATESTAAEFVKSLFKH